MPLDRAGILERLAGQRFATLATIHGHRPQAAVVGIVSRGDEVFFDTLGTSRKAVNLRKHHQAALVVWQDAWTIQLEGTVDEPKGSDLQAFLDLYLARFPDGKERQAWPDISYFRLRATWLRYSDFGCNPPEITELPPATPTP
jgi:hypothetical protein